ncbi:unnamed protein product [Rotaria socialis]|uniref:Uncharacterized protein n=1 Tax=Rotaria socialis TaxID=392032 RepID=A0A819C1S9_9BILA|nr:unnamed protein product [Rotaria socialis]CAF3316903.1 unnamed protein product [Rotaria socialis]CAF3380186.1 unnamed protein product [Rotaria socialis]CAF3442625.1 unnamed protein product [Rotaria socialis]CAF3811360.1 unnamed protein product [Rotaria socialis]
MRAYHYCLCLLVFVVITNARHIEQASNNDSDEDAYVPNKYHRPHVYRSNFLEHYLLNLIAGKGHDDDRYDQTGPFERRSKAITKGDPREFMG